MGICIPPTLRASNSETTDRYGSGAFPWAEVDLENPVVRERWIAQALSLWQA